MSLLVRPKGGLLLSVEGPSGVGKTYIVEKLKKKYDIVATDEVTEKKDNINSIVLSAINKLNGDYDIFLSKAEPLKTFMLLSTIYISYYENHIIPSLRKGKIVVMDRGIDSPSILQSVLFLLNDKGISKIMSLRKTFLDILLQFVFPPDITLVIENDYNTCIKNVEKRENTTLSPTQLLFLQKVHEVFSSLPPKQRYMHRSAEDAYFEISKQIERYEKNSIVDPSN